MINTLDKQLELVKELHEIINKLNDLDDSSPEIPDGFNERFNLLAHKLALRYVNDNAKMLDFVGEEYRELFLTYIKQQKEIDEQEQTII